eukprot:1463693-Rhodomonas_salina.1
MSTRTLGSSASGSRPLARALQSGAAVLSAPPPEPAQRPRVASPRQNLRGPGTPARSNQRTRALHKCCVQAGRGACVLSASARNGIALRRRKMSVVVDAEEEVSVRHRQHVSVRHLTTRVCALAIQQDAPDKVIKAYAEAVQTVDPEKADGKPHTLWVAFAKYYEDNDDLDSARDIFVRATQVKYRATEDLASVWCEYAEMELRHDNFDLVRAHARSAQRRAEMHRWRCALACVIADIRYDCSYAHTCPVASTSTYTPHMHPPANTATATKKGVSTCIRLLANAPVDVTRQALKVLHKSVSVSDKVAQMKDITSLPVQQRVWKSTRLWSIFLHPPPEHVSLPLDLFRMFLSPLDRSKLPSFARPDPKHPKVNVGVGSGVRYADLEESLGTLESTKQ